jgi:hypothetical protein
LFPLDREKLNRDLEEADIAEIIAGPELDAEKDLDISFHQ